MGYMPMNMTSRETLKLANKETKDVFVGAFKKATTGKSTMTRWKKIDPQTINTTSVMPINPILLAMAAMMVQINHKLDAIQQTQQTILSFMQEDKKAKLQGDLNMLSDILDKYKYNWDNEQYRNSYHIKALDIKQDAEHNIIFYQSQIAEKINGLPSIHLDQTVKSVMEKIADDFHNYSMALYLFSFSSYLEVMLLGNFARDYLQAVAHKVQEYQAFYQDQFDKCRGFIEKISGDSVQTKVQGALGQTGKFLGNLIASSPLLSKGPVDEWLKDGGEMLLKGKDEKVAKLVAAFDERQDTGYELFVDSIRNVETVCNDTNGMLFDNENLYLLA